DKLKVLIIEDSEEDTDLLLLELKRGGFDPMYQRVDTAAGMAAALDGGKWDVILSDYSMPRFTLAEALEMLKARNLDVPFLVVSATIVDEQAVAAMKAGACDFVMKDRMARLAPAIRRELKECEIRRERKSLEEQIRQSQRLESLGLLAGGVAHDFNNLLTGILGNASLALDVLDPPEPARSMLESVIQATERAADLTRQLLAYAGKGRFFVRPVDVSALVRDISELMRTSIPKKVRFTLDLANDLPPVEADATQIQQLVMNLVLNAGEAMGDQGGSIQLITRLEERPSNGASSSLSGWYIRLEVRDTGCGMDEATRSQIFDPFFSTKFTGRGLGLAAALGIARGHKGQIDVESSPGNGSVFRVWLPAAETGSSIERGLGAAHRTHPDLAGSGTILIIDDEEVVRGTAKAALEHYGYTVRVAENGPSGISLFHAIGDQISMVLLDLTMPEMSGEETFDQLRQIEPALPIIISSGYDEAEASRRFTGKGVSGFLKKPYTAETLAERTNAALSVSSRKMQA
ncbi:MAG: Chemotaxis protein methyltransferase CheR, partial [Bryobacterales bacterium]|nr:Chemotaxis protein methyltransferase CheR [Bryobacterales bacterium]